MTRRLALWLTGLGALVLFVALGVLDQRLEQTGGPGIIPFEVAGSLKRAQEILADWGPDGRDTARLSLWLDFPFLAAYGAFLALAVAALRDLAARRGWRRLAPARALVVLPVIGAAGLDALENLFLLLTISEHGGSTSPRLAAIFAALKFALLGATVVYILAVSARAAVSMRRATPPAR